MNCYAEGYNAFTVGMRLTENPHKDLYNRIQWSKGWISAKIPSIWARKIKQMVSHCDAAREQRKNNGTKITW